MRAIIANKHQFENEGKKVPPSGQPKTILLLRGPFYGVLACAGDRTPLNRPFTCFAPLDFVFSPDECGPLGCGWRSNAKLSTRFVGPGFVKVCALYYFKFYSPLNSYYDWFILVYHSSSWSAKPLLDYTFNRLRPNYDF